MFSNRKKISRGNVRGQKKVLRNDSFRKNVAEENGKTDSLVLGKYLCGDKNAKDCYGSNKNADDRFDNNDLVRKQKGDDDGNLNMKARLSHFVDQTSVNVGGCSDDEIGLPYKDISGVKEESGMDEEDLLDGSGITYDAAELNAVDNKYDLDDMFIDDSRLDGNELCGTHSNKITRILNAQDPKCCVNINMVYLQYIKEDLKLLNIVLKFH